MISKQTALWLGAGASAGLAAWSLLRPEEMADISGQVALITGGSRGLGLELARQFAELGCAVAICGRDEDQLERARRDLLERAKARPAGVRTFPCDVSNREQVENMAREATAHFGQIDILVANAGEITVGPIESMGIEDFEQAMSVMFWGVLYPIEATLPQMMERGSGRIAIITSIGGKAPVPHLVPYACAKFAAVALAEGLRAELKPKGIHVTNIVPGLMRTGSHLNAAFKGRQELEYAWFGLAASTPGVSMAVERAARKIITAIRRGEAEKTLTTQAQLFARLHGAFPELTLRIMELAGRMMPSGRKGGEKAVGGLDAEARLNSWLYQSATAFGRAAARTQLQV